MPGITGRPRAAKGSRVQVGGANLAWGKWSATLKGDDLDTVTFEDGGNDTGTIGVVGVDWTMGGNWDAHVNAFDSPPGIYPRDDLPDTKLYESVGDNVFWDFPIGRVISSQNGAEVKELVKIEASCKSQGSFSRPTGNL